jgi:serine/threonine protein kinase
MPFEAGAIIGSYQLVEQLGSGGMATVFKAYHPSLDRFVAIKVMHQAFLEDENFLARFQREARLVARLDHPNIVPVYDFAEFEGRPYLVMKFIEGKTLKHYLRSKTLGLREILQIVEAVGGALAYAHNQNVLHRDVKPSNVLLSNDGHIYLADFGLARIAQGSTSTLTSDMMIGTPQYISPEQAMSKPDLDCRTDIYSLGVIIYEMVVGRVPFQNDTPFATVHDHLYTPLPLPRAINPAIPASVEHVIIHSLQKDRDDRYGSVEELLKAFQYAVSIEEMAASEEKRTNLSDKTENKLSQPAFQAEIASVATKTTPDNAQKTQGRTDTALLQEEERSEPGDLLLEKNLDTIPFPPESRISQPVTPEPLPEPQIDSTSPPQKGNDSEIKLRKRKKKIGVLGIVAIVAGILVCVLLFIGILSRLPKRSVPSFDEKFSISTQLGNLKNSSLQTQQPAQIKITPQLNSPLAIETMEQALEAYQRGDMINAQNLLGRFQMNAGMDKDLYRQAVQFYLDNQAPLLASIVLFNVYRLQPDNQLFIVSELRELVYISAVDSKAKEFLERNPGNPILEVPNLRHELYNGNLTSFKTNLDTYLKRDQQSRRFPEIFLVEAEYFVKTNQPDKARRSLESLLGMAGIPDWVKQMGEEMLRSIR